MGARRAVAGAAAAFFLMGWFGAARAVAPREAIARAGKFLVDRQTADGAWGTAPAVDDVADGVVGLVSARVGERPIAKAVDYVASHAPAEANRAAMVSRVIFAAVAAGKDPRNFGRVDYVGRLRAYYNPTTGAYDQTTDPNSLAILAAVAAGEPLPERALPALKARQCEGGGFPRGATCVLGADVGVTALALNAMAAGGVGSSDPVYAAARTYLLNAQNSEGGFASAPGGPTEAQATSRVVMAIVAMREDPVAAPWRRSATADPVIALSALQDGSGGFKPDRATTAPDDVTTARALPGFAGLALPVRPATAEPPPPSTPTTAAGGSQSQVTPTTAPTRATTAASTPGTGPRAAVSTPVPGTDPGIALASPSRREDSDNGRSLVGLIPFIATLFGAGAVGVVLRRRARI